MSLINDALKRAKAQQSSGDAPKVQFRPVDPAKQPPKKSHTTIWIAVVIIVGLVIGFVFRQLTRENRNAAPKEVKAREVVPANPTPQAPPAPIASAPTQDVAAVPIIREPEPRIVPKLQAVVFDPKHPSAIIGGRSVFVGDRVNDLRVVAISRESVTLAGGGQTNVLALGE